jgi:hypothetical protein
MRSKTKRPLDQAIILAALFSLLLVGNFEVALAAEPIRSAPMDSSGPATIFRARGSIDRIYRQGSDITFFADAPFWGPPRYGVGQAYLWPKDTAFVLHVGTVPITIDGKKAGFHDLNVGQNVQVQYYLRNGGLGIGCVAYRIDARSAPGKFIPDGQAHSPRLVGRWRTLGSGFASEYRFAADGAFTAEVAFAREPLHRIAGKWWVTGDQLHYDIISSDIRGYSSGTKDQDKLLQLTKDHYVIEGRNGSQHRYVRVKG